MRVRDLGDRLDINDIQRWIANGLTEDQFCLRRDRLGEVLRILGVDEFRINIKLR
jgi:hypothetical protein